MRIGINGFGRTGRLILRQSIDRDEQVVHINDPNMDLDTVMYLIRYDTVHGRFLGTIEIKQETLYLNGKEIVFTNHSEPKLIDWSKSGAEYICESSGKFLTRETTVGHLLTAKKVIIAAPPKDDIPLFVVGCNVSNYDPSMDIISNSSCNTNCLALLCKVLHTEFGIVEGFMTTIHAVTGTQSTVDGPNKKDRRRGRSCNYNIVPSTTGAAKSVGKVIPELQGKLTGMAFRVPAVDMCIIDLTVKLQRTVTYEQVVEKMREYERGELKGLLRVCDDEIVSSDLIGDVHSCIFDARSGIALNGSFMKLIAWTDNEVAYSTRMLDLIHFIATRE